MKDSTSKIVDGIERMRKSQLTDEELGEIEIWQKGRALGQLVNLPGWEVQKEMLDSYVLDQIHVLLNTDPANRDEVLAAHAVAFSANRIRNNFVTDIHNAVEKAREAPSSLRKAVSAIPPESMNF